MKTVIVQVALRVADDADEQELVKHVQEDVVDNDYGVEAATGTLIESRPDPAPE